MVGFKPGKCLTERSDALAAAWYSFLFPAGGESDSQRVKQPICRPTAYVLLLIRCQECLAVIKLGIQIIHKIA